MLTSSATSSKLQLTNFLNYFGLCPEVQQKWIYNLKGNVTEPLEKRSVKDEISLNKLNSLQIGNLSLCKRSIRYRRLQPNKG